MKIGIRVQTKDKTIGKVTNRAISNPDRWLVELPNGNCDWYDVAELSEIHDEKSEDIETKCEHKNKELKVFATFEYWYCPECKQEVEETKYLSPEVGDVYKDWEDYLIP